MSDKSCMTTGAFCWNELMTGNVSKAKKFYTEMFGWESHDHVMEHCTYTMFKKDDKDIGGMMQTPKDKEGMIPPHWLSYILVEKLEPMIEHAKQLGGEIVVGATEVGDFGRFAVIKDPTGAVVALWQSLKSC